MLEPYPPKVGDISPWGPIQAVTALGPDAIVASTASHGGIRVSPAGLARIPKPLRETAFSRDGWFEEDCDWCIPYLVLGLAAFEPDAAEGARRHAAARSTLKRWQKTSAGLVLGLSIQQAGR